MRLDDLVRSVGNPVKDIYGRYVGYITAFTTDGPNEPKSIAVDVGSGVLRLFPSNQFVVGERGPVLLPAWKVKAQGWGREISVVRKRIDGLKSLVEDGEIPESTFDDMNASYTEKLKELEESRGEFTRELERRQAEIEKDTATIEQLMVEAKVQHRCGELDDEVYEVVSGNCTAMRTKNNQEKDEIARLLKTGGVEEETTRISLTINQPSSQPYNA